MSTRHLYFSSQNKSLLKPQTAWRELRVPRGLHGGCMAGAPNATGSPRSGLENEIASVAVTVGAEMGIFLRHPKSLGLRSPRDLQGSAEMDNHPTDHLFSLGRAPNLRKLESLTGSPRSTGFPEIGRALEFLDFDGRLTREPFHRPPVSLLILSRPKREAIAESPRSTGSPKDRAKQQRRAKALQTMQARKEFQRHPIRRSGVQ